MLHPKFQIGEEVILCSKVRPHLNGEYIIEDIQETLPHERNQCKWNSGNVYYTPNGDSFGYKLVGLSYPHSKEGVRGYLIRESSLRKKHKPADSEFTEWFKSVTNKDK